MSVKGFDGETVHNEKHLNTKMKSCEIKMINFCDNGIPKEGSNCICLLVILIDSFFKIKKNYYCQVFLEECKNIVK